MSDCGCDEAKKRVHDFLSQELDENKSQDVIDHLANCDDCESEYYVEERVKTLVKLNLGDDVNQEVRQKLEARLIAVAAEIARIEQEVAGQISLTENS